MLVVFIGKQDENIRCDVAYERSWPRVEARSSQLTWPNVEASRSQACVAKQVYI